MPLIHLLLPLLAQVGPFTAPGTMGTPFPEKVVRPPKSAPATAQRAPEPESAKAQDCRAAVDQDASAALDLARTWQASATGPAKVEAGMCLGLAHSQLQDWAAAQADFTSARDLPGTAPAMRARLGVMAANAALAAGAAQPALAALDTARADAAKVADPALQADIAIDRARAFVALGRNADADTALADARTAAPDNAEAWLLSATLARRMKNLAEAQARIERAAALLPADPAIGLEAGVIAMLSGHEDAARKSWDSVVKTAPSSPEATTAGTYLAQLGPVAKP
jgi:tetratricopeptide (TPR) repeat protein